MKVSAEGKLVKTVSKLIGEFQPFSDQVILLMPVVKTKLVLSPEQKKEAARSCFKPLQVVAAGPNTGLVKGDFVLIKENAFPAYLYEFTANLEGFEYGAFALHQLITKVSNFSPVEIEE